MMTERPRFWLQLTPADDFPNPARRLAMVLKDLLRQHRFKCLGVGEIASGQAEEQNDNTTNTERTDNQ
jgi:hypothetical protein